MAKLLGALLLVFAAAAGALGLLWTYVDAVGTEWDYCGGHGSGCIAGWKLGVSLIVLAALVGVIGLSLLRRARR